MADRTAPVVKLTLSLTLVARTHRFATVQNVTDDRDRQTTQCAKGATDSTVGQKTPGFPVLFLKGAVLEKHLS